VNKRQILFLIKNIRLFILESGGPSSFPYIYTNAVPSHLLISPFPRLVKMFWVSCIVSVARRFLPGWVTSPRRNRRRLFLVWQIIYRRQHIRSKTSFRWKKA